MRGLALHRQEICSLDKRHFNRPRRRLSHRACKPITRKPKVPCLAFPDGAGFKQDLETMLDMANSLRHDPEKPVFHVMPRHGWVGLPDNGTTIILSLVQSLAEQEVPYLCVIKCMLMQINDPNGPVYYEGKYHV